MAKCIEQDCEEQAGTPWTPVWCRVHDEERRARVLRQLKELRDDLKTTRSSYD